MMTLRHGVETFFFISFATAIVLFVMVQRNGSSKPLSFASVPVAITPIPTEVPAGPQVSIMDSPEGSKTLTLEKQGSWTSPSYSLFISSKSDEQRLQIFKKEETSSQSLEIPFNTWSPDKVYVFLKETTPSLNNYLVFQSSGNFFPNDLPFVSIQELFKKKVPNYLIEDVTGWAAPNLLVVNAKASEGEKKVSFWFDVPSQSFIQLGTYFR